MLKRNNKKHVPLQMIILRAFFHERIYKAADSMETKHYTILRTKKTPKGQCLWEGSVWEKANTLAVDCFLPESSAHHPQTFCRLLYTQDRIYGIFRVEDRFVRCTHTGFQEEVYKDSCVEFFVQPKEGSGYFNFEFNCGGALCASYVTDPERIAIRVKEFLPLTADDDRQILRYTGLPKIIEPEIETAIVWYLEFSIPFIVLEKYAGLLGKIKGQRWRANFYKCGDETSHPHWASWSPLAARNFHAPASFGSICFE
jgi:hypothetical protein